MDFIDILKRQLVKESPVPLYRQILNVLRAEIQNGDYEPGDRLPTETEMEANLGVSRVTIRQALNAAVEEGLIVRMSGKGTFISQTVSTPVSLGFIGYVGVHLSGSFDMDILSGAERVVQEKGYHLIFSKSEGNLISEDRLLKRLAQDNVNGYLVMPVFSADSDRELTRLVERNVPLVLIDRPVMGLQTNSVTSEHFEGGQEIVRHLIAQGYRDILYLARQPLGLPSVAERLRGYQNAMLAAGLPVREPYVLDAQTAELGYNQAQRLPTYWDNEAVEAIVELLRGNDRPQAIVAMNDIMALFVFEAARQTGLRIPEDLGLVGFDNLDFAAAYELTTMAQRPHQIGIEAANLLVQRMQGEKSREEQVRVPVDLVVRCSSRRQG